VCAGASWGRFNRLVEGIELTTCAIPCTSLTSACAISIGRVGSGAGVGSIGVVSFCARATHKREREREEGNTSPLPPEEEPLSDCLASCPRVVSCPRIASSVAERRCMTFEGVMETKSRRRNTSEALLRM